MRMVFTIVTAGMLVLPYTPALADALAERLASYEATGAGDFSAERGAAMWTRAFPDAAGGKPRSCASCHTDDLRAMGEHLRTGKTIAPMAPAVNAKRLQDGKFIEKWFARNCTWTLGRACTVQEKGDFLVFIRSR